MDSPTPDIPDDAPGRWRPTRAGLVNVWRYWDETFAFHRGRLLLRGPNGSGKSLGLELLLPFLFDANASPSRLTSAAKARGSLYDRMMSGHVGTTTRSGFAWLEFERGEETFTLGVRLRASHATHKAEPVFFTTSQRVGDTLHLLDEHRTPLGRRQLIGAIGDAGRVHDSGGEHRAAVRRTLFRGISEERYDALIVALLALRKEKLSQNLDLTKMSDTLAQALPPLEEQDLAAVAEGFERLDRRRAELDAQADELKVVERLTRRRRRYARRVCARGSLSVREAETARDSVTRRVREAETQLETSERERAAALEAEARDTTREAELAAELDAIRASEAYRAGAQLDDVRREADGARERAARDASTAERLEARAAREARSARTAAEALADAERERTSARADAVAAATPAGAVETVSEADDERAALAWSAGRRARLAELRTALAASVDASRARDREAAAVADEEQELEARREAAGEADAGLAEAHEAYADAVRAWTASATSIGTERATAALDGAAGPTDVEGALATLRRELDAERAVERRDVAARREALAAEREPLEAERDALARAVPSPPPAPEWRTPRGPVGGPTDGPADGAANGVALWQLVEVRPGVEPAEVDRIEAALTGAGLIDARVEPDGRVRVADGASDVVLGAAPDAGPNAAPNAAPNAGPDAPGPSLADVLEPLGGGAGAVPDDIVRAVLGAIALRPAALDGASDAPGEGDADRARASALVVGRDATFRVGSAGGRGPDRPARLLGAAARERRRLERLAELDAALAALADDDAALVRALAALDVRVAAAAADFDARPSGEPVRAAELARHAAGTRAESAEAAAARARRRLQGAENALRVAHRELVALGVRHELPTDAAALDAVAVALDRLESSLRGWRARIDEAGRARAEHERAARRTEESGDEATRAREAATASSDHAAASRVRYETLERAVGADYQGLLATLGEREAERAATLGRLRDARGALVELAASVARLGERLATAREASARAEAARDAAQARFRALYADGVVEDAGLESVAPAAPDEGVTAVLVASRALARELGDEAVDEESLAKALGDLQDALHGARGALGGRVDLDLRWTEHGWWALDARSEGLRESVGALRARSHAALEIGRGELADEEEALFERTLAGSIRRALAARIRGANALVDTINAQLEAVRTAAGGVGVRLRWAVGDDQPDAVRRARDLLLRDPQDLDAAERASLQDFVRARVEQARSELDVHAPWQERLRETLDYRRWHRFALELAHRDWEGMKPATERLLQRLSTGERSIALHLPMLASIAAHYTGEDGEPLDCPRLILLDELFAGVDEANRAQLFGTFSRWGLDAIFTSDHEWCTYSTLDGIAIHYLHPSGDGEPVTSTRFTWDGRERVQDRATA